VLKRNIFFKNYRPQNKQEVKKKPLPDAKKTEAE